MKNFLLILLALTLISCGQSGSLYLPGKAPEKSSGGANNNSSLQ